MSKEMIDENYRNFINHVFVINFDKQITNELKNAIDKVIHSLKGTEEQPERTRIALQMRFGLPPYNSKHTLKSIASQFNKNRERIRQVLEKAYRQMRHPSRSQEILSYLGNVYD